MSPYFFALFQKKLPSKATKLPLRVTTNDNQRCIINSVQTVTKSRMHTAEGVKASSSTARKNLRLCVITATHLSAMHPAFFVFSYLKRQEVSVTIQKHFNKKYHIQPEYVQGNLGYIYCSATKNWQKKAMQSTLPFLYPFFRRQAGRIALHKRPICFFCVLIALSVKRRKGQSK